MTLYVDIGEVQIELQAANCNRLLAEGWVLLGVYPLAKVGEMVQGTADGTQKQDTQRYGGRFVGFVVGKRSAFLSSPRTRPGLLEVANPGSKPINRPCQLFPQNGVTL